jgi:hypothetical protein
MPFVRQPPVNKHIMSILCNATKFNVRRGILTLNGTRFRRQSSIGQPKICPWGPKAGFFGLGFEVLLTAEFVMPGACAGHPRLSGKKDADGAIPAMTTQQVIFWWLRGARAKA